MVRRSTPASRIHTKSVEPDSASGRPEEKPRNSTISTRGCRYTAMAARQEVRLAGGTTLSSGAAVIVLPLSDLAGEGQCGKSARDLSGISADGENRLDLDADSHRQ